MPEGPDRTGGESLAFEARLQRGAFTLNAAFRVSSGQTVMLVGPSGSGKSTCLQLIAGLLRPDRGRIALGETALCDMERGIDLPPERRRIGLLFQEYALFPHMSVRENVAYGARARGASRASAAATADSWIARMGLAEYASRSPDRLSGGQRQRVALARALATEPRALLLDEPFGALDVRTRAAVRGELRGFLREAGLPAVVVSHDPLDALTFGDRVVVLEEGQVVQEGTREALLGTPRSAFVATLAGLNLYEATVATGHGVKSAAVGPVIFHVLADDLSGPAYLAFGPEEVVLSIDRIEGSPQNAFQGTVREVASLPDRLRVVLDAGVPITAEVTRESRVPLEPGARLWATIKATAIRVYP